MCLVKIMITLDFHINYFAAPVSFSFIFITLVYSFMIKNLCFII